MLPAVFFKPPPSNPPKYQKDEAKQKRAAETVTAREWEHAHPFQTPTAGLKSLGLQRRALTGAGVCGRAAQARHPAGRGRRTRAGKALGGAAQAGAGAERRARKRFDGVGDAPLAPPAAR